MANFSNNLGVKYYHALALPIRSERLSGESIALLLQILPIHMVLPSFAKYILQDSSRTPAFDDWQTAVELETSLHHQKHTSISTEDTCM